MNDGALLPWIPDALRLDVDDPPLYKDAVIYQLNVKPSGLDNDRTDR